MALALVTPDAPVDYRLQTFRNQYVVQGMVGKSPAMKSLYSEIERAGRTKAPVLITGPSGTGKELIARALHDFYRAHHLRSRGGPFIPVNSASIPDDLLESTLFGYVKGAFTGADRNTPGKFELAHGGTLYLDEIADLSLRHQSKILRAVEEHEVSRLGTGEVRHVDVKIVTATNKDLERLIQERQFREDLYYRLSVIPIEAPPLSQRQGDIRILIDYFLLLFSKEYKRNVSVTPDGYAFLEAQPWPGNVRQLRNFIERAFVLSEEPFLDRQYLDALAEGKIIIEQRSPAMNVLAFSVQASPSGISIEDTLSRVITTDPAFARQTAAVDLQEFGEYTDRVKRMGTSTDRLESVASHLNIVNRERENGLRDVKDGLMRLEDLQQRLENIGQQLFTLNTPPKTYERRNYHGNPLAYYRENIDKYRGMKRTQFAKADSGLAAALRRHGQLDLVMPKTGNYRGKLKPAEIREVLSAYRPSGGNASVASRNSNGKYSQNTYTKYWRKKEWPIIRQGSSMAVKERKKVIAAFKLSNGNASKTAKKLPYTRQTISRIWKEEKLV